MLTQPIPQGAIGAPDPDAPANVMMTQPIPQGEAPVAPAPYPAAPAPDPAPTPQGPLPTPPPPPQGPPPHTMRLIQGLHEQVEALTSRVGVLERALNEYRNEAWVLIQ